MNLIVVPSGNFGRGFAPSPMQILPGSPHTQWLVQLSLHLAPELSPLPRPSFTYLLQRSSFTMLKASRKVSDLFLSPGGEPVVELNGRLVPVTGPGLKPLTPDDTCRIAGDLIGSNKNAEEAFETGIVRHLIPPAGPSRFRVNVFHAAWESRDRHAGDSADLPALRL